MTPSNFRKLRALDQAYLYAKQARFMAQEAYARDTDPNRRKRLDEVLVSLQEYEDMTSLALNKAYENLTKDQT